MGGDILEDMGGFAKDLVEEIPGVGAITKNLGKLSNNLQRWWQRRGNSLLKDLDSIEPHQITELLPTGLLWVEPLFAFYLGYRVIRRISIFPLVPPSKMPSFRKLCAV
jgi:hypothetical protein